MDKRNLVVIGASAGGVEALLSLVPSLPRDLAASVLVAVHVAPRSASNLPKLLAYRSRLPVAYALDGQALADPGVWVAPPDRHLVVQDGVTRLSRGPRENGHRPAIDILFRSAARARGPASIAVVLSGNLDDGSAGMEVIRRAGGIGIVQDPEEAAYPDMPRNALEMAGADHVARIEELGPLLVRLVSEPITPRPEVALRRDNMMSEAVFSCPECGGVLELEGPGTLRFRCRVGHGFGGEALAAAQDDRLDAALWTAVRTLNEQAELARRLAARAHARGHDHAALRYEERVHELSEKAHLVRAALGVTSLGEVPTDQVPPEEAAAGEGGVISQSAIRAE
jgi:two-component system chemotaxis response regulator CheB